MERKAKLYAAKSTQLSNQLEQAEQFLEQMPGKMQISVTGSSKWDVLEFCRKGEGWGLYYGVEEDGSWVTEAPVQVKAAAAKLLPELVERLITTQADKLSEVEIGLDALSGLPFLIAEDQGGAQ